MRQPARQLPGPAQLLHRRPPVRRRRTAPGDRSAAGRPHQPYQQRFQRRVRRRTAIAAGPLREGDMSDTTAPRPEPPKHDPETLVLKATPRRTVRFRRKLLVGIAAVACGGVLGVTWLALQGPGMRIGQQGQELYNRSEEHTSELQSLMRISYAVFCLK